MLFLQNELAGPKPGDPEWYSVEGGDRAGCCTSSAPVQSVARNFFLCVVTDRLLVDIVNMNLMV